MNVKSVSPLSLSAVTSRDESRQGRNPKEDSHTSPKKEASEEKIEEQPLFLEHEEIGVPLLETVKWLSLIKYRPRKRRANTLFKKVLPKNKGFDKKI